MVQVKTKEEQLEEQLEGKRRREETIQRIRTELNTDTIEGMLRARKMFVAATLNRPFDEEE